jgi:hypothetical protein
VSQPFRVHCALTAFEKSGENDGLPMRIGGVVSTDELDQEDEVLVQQGLDFAPFLAKGWFNDNHSKSTLGILGYPTAAQFVRKGAVLPNGGTAGTNGWYAEGYLLNTEQGRQIWELAKALQGTPRQLGFSIEGSVRARDPRNPKRVTKAVVKHVAITHCPVNLGTELEVLAKALTAGHGIDSSELSGPGNAGALRTESLDFDGDGDPDFEVEDDDSDELSLDEIELSELAPRGVSKAEGGDEPIDEMDAFEEWADAFASVDPNPPTGLTKSEARLIVLAELPWASDEEIEEIVNSASRGS